MEECYDDEDDLEYWEPEEKVSRTRMKKEMISLQKLGEHLVDLADQQLEKIPLEDDLREAVRFAKTLTSHGARRRQMQYIGALMRKADTEPIERGLELIRQGLRLDGENFRKVERWREDLLLGDQETFDALAETFPELDRQHLNQLIRNARKERERASAGEGSGPGETKAFRQLFRYLNDLLKNSEA